MKATVRLERLVTKMNRRQMQTLFTARHMQPRFGNTQTWLVTRLADGHQATVRTHAMCTAGTAIAQAVRANQWFAVVQISTVEGAQ